MQLIKFQMIFIVLPYLLLPYCPITNYKVILKKLLFTYNNNLIDLKYIKILNYN